MEKSHLTMNELDTQEPCGTCGRPLYLHMLTPKRGYQATCPRPLTAPPCEECHLCFTHSAGCKQATVATLGSVPIIAG